MTNNLNAMEAKMNTNDNTTATRITAAFERTTAPAPIKVWLVDDDDSYRTLLAEFLVTQQGIDCPRHFDSPDAALSALASKTGPDVLLLDIQMRDRNGLDAIRPIKSLARSTRVLMLTTFYDVVPIRARWRREHPGSCSRAPNSSSWSRASENRTLQVLAARNGAEPGRLFKRLLRSPPRTPAVQATQSGGGGFLC